MQVMEAQNEQVLRECAELRDQLQEAVVRRGHVEREAAVARAEVVRQRENEKLHIDSLAAAREQVGVVVDVLMC